MGDREIELVLRARNITQAAFTEVNKLIEEMEGKTKKTTASGMDFSSMLGTATGLLGAFGIGLSVNALVNFGKGLLENAGALADLSVKTGASVEQLQRWTFVGDQSGVTTAQFADALFKLGVRLAGGAGAGQGLRDAVEQIGLSFEKLKAQKPDEQFNSVVQALEAMEDGGERNRIGLELFGKSFAGISPAVAKGYTEMAAQAKVSSDAQIKAIDAASDAFDRFIANQKSSLTSWLGNMVIANEQHGKLTKEQLQQYAAIVKGGGDAQAFLLNLAKTQVDHVLPAQEAVIVQTKNYLTAVANAMVEVNRLTTAEVANIQAAQRLGASTEEITNEFGISAGALKVLTDRTKDHEAAQKKAADAQEKAAKIEAAAVLGVTKLWDEYYLLRGSHGATANEVAILQIKRWEADTIAAAIKAGTATKDFYEALAVLSKEKMAAVGNDFDAAFRAKSIPALQEMAATARETYSQMVMSGQFFRDDLEAQRQKVKELEAAARGMGQSYVDAFKAAQEAAAALLAAQQALRAEERQRQLESRQIGGSFDVTSQNFEQALRSIATSGGWNPTGMGSNIDMGRAFGYAHAGYSLQEIIAIFARERAGASGPVPPPQGPRIPGFFDGVENFGGGLARVHRDELIVNLPRGTDVIPARRSSGGGTIVYNVTVNVGTALASKQELARYVQEAMVDLARAEGRRFGRRH